MLPQGTAISRRPTRKSRISEGLRAYVLIFYVLGFTPAQIGDDVRAEADVSISRTTIWRWINEEADLELRTLHQLNVARRVRMMVAAGSGRAEKLREVLQSKAMQWVPEANLILRIIGDPNGRRTASWMLRRFGDGTGVAGGVKVHKRLPAMVRRLNAEERERPDLALGLILLEQNAYSEVEFDREKWIDLFGKKRIGVEGI